MAATAEAAPGSSRGAEQIAVAAGAGPIKTGSGCRSGRVAKFNQFLRIEEQLGVQAQFAGRPGFGR